MKALKSQIDFCKYAEYNKQSAGGYYYLLSSQWVSGSGRYISRRAIPADAVEVDLSWTRSKTKAIQNACGLIIKRHPRAQKVILFKKSLVKKLEVA